MVRGRKPLSTAVKQANGSFVKHPGRQNHNEPQPTKSRPKLPTSLHGDNIGKKTWHRIIGYLEDMKLLAVVDLDIVETYSLNQSLLVASWAVISDANADPESKRYTRANMDWHKTMDRRLKLLPELGLTASGRTRLMVAIDDDEDDPIAKFFETLGSKNS